LFLVLCVAAYYFFNRPEDRWAELRQARGVSAAWQPSDYAPAGPTVCTVDHALEGGTDAASMVIFDPGALPADFDAQWKTDAAAQVEQLTREGRLYWLNTCADGSYTLGVYVGDGLPKRLHPFAKRLDVREKYPVASGRLYFTGIEYAFRADDSLLRKYRHMGESIELAPGEYRAEFFEFDYPPDFHEDLLEKRLPSAQFRAHQLMNVLAPIGCMSVLALFGSKAFLGWAEWLTFALPFGIALVALPLLWSRLPAYKQAASVYKGIGKEFPGYGVLLQAVATN
jgi:hypothetical protein